MKERYVSKKLILIKLSTAREKWCYTKWASRCTSWNQSTPAGLPTNVLTKFYIKQFNQIISSV